MSFRYIYTTGQKPLDGCLAVYKTLVKYRQFPAQNWSRNRMFIKGLSWQTRRFVLVENNVVRTVFSDSSVVDQLCHDGPQGVTRLVYYPVSRVTFLQGAQNAINKEYYGNTSHKICTDILSSNFTECRNYRVRIFTCILLKENMDAVSDLIFHACIYVVTCCLNEFPALLICG